MLHREDGEFYDRWKAPTSRAGRRHHLVCRPGSFLSYEVMAGETL
jgi:hypothetical protein